jgi:hypothetical protein
MSVNRTPFDGAIDTSPANRKHAGQMPRWATASSTIASFATQRVAGHNDIYVPLATTALAGAQSAADKAAGDLMANRPRAVLTRSTNQAIANATITAIAWDSAFLNTGGAAGGTIWSAGTNPTRITAPLQGIYLVTASVVIDAAAGGTLRLAQLDAIASFVFANASSPPSGAANWVRLTASGLVSLAPTNYVEFEVYQDSGGALNVRNGNPQPYIALEWFSP